MSKTESNTYIYGRNPVTELLQNNPEKAEKIYIRNNVQGQQIKEIQDLASSNRIPVSYVPGAKLYDLVGNVNDQGIVALVGTVEYREFEEWLERLDISSRPAVLLLDEIEDPHNVGAIIRSAAAAGISAVLVPKHRRAPITPAVYKTSAGTVNRIPIVRAGNLNQSILKLKDAGFWIAGLDQRGDKILWELEVDRPLAFVIGSEDAGIRKKTLEHCDYVFRIPMENRVESLNASVSAALICYEWRRNVRAPG